MCGEVGIAMINFALFEVKNGTCFLTSGEQSMGTVADVWRERERESQERGEERERERESQKSGREMSMRQYRELAVDVGMFDVSATGWKENRVELYSVGSSVPFNTVYNGRRLLGFFFPLPSLLSPLHTLNAMWGGLGVLDNDEIPLGSASFTQGAADHRLISLRDEREEGEGEGERERKKEEEEEEEEEEQLLYFREWRLKPVLTNDSVSLPFSFWISCGVRGELRGMCFCVPYHF